MVAPDRERLRAAFRLRGPGGERPPDARDRAHDLRAFLRDRAAGLGGGARPRVIVALPDGEEVSNECGAFWRRRLPVPLQRRHGAGDLAAAARAGPARLGKGDELAALRPETCLFLDTETTGLGGGAGTVVFLVGLCWLQDEEWIVEQCFLRDFGEEPAMLAHVAARLVERPHLVTYVGKTFDRHRLAARMTVCGVPAPILSAPHLDLYHTARRTWGRTLPDCRLKTVERHVLGLVRDDDLPGSEAPAAWLQWLRDRTGAVDRVLEHNRLDVLSLVALLGVLGAPPGPPA